MRTKATWYGCIMASMIFAACGPGTEPNDAQNPKGKNPGGKGDIIGEDDRRDEFSGDVSDELRALGRATAMVMESINVIDADDKNFTLAGQPLQEGYMMCPDEPFASQPATGMCSAWLVAPDIMVTNGHCITSQSDCENKSFVFDYAITEEGKDPNVVPLDNVVSCKQVLAWDNTSHCDVDFAVVQLERPVTDREPVKVRGPQDDLAGDDLVIIGHPFGLPRKYALKGSVLNKTENGFTTNHDIFGGNSGSAIFDAKSGAVQGLIACGGSNVQWDTWEGDWKLERKTGKSCDDTCDGAGEFAEGTMEPSSICDESPTRRRCSCDDGQLVWETRDCLSFESQTDGQCSREQRVSTFTCDTAPWLCATPYAQHTNIFSMFVDQWDVATNDEELTIPVGGDEVTSTLTLDGDKTLQALSVLLKLEDTDGLSDSFNMSVDLTIKLTRTDGEGDPIEVVVSSPEAGAADGTAYGLGNNPHSDTQAFMVPFILKDFEGTLAQGTYTISIVNQGVIDYILKSWHIQTIQKEDAGKVISSAPCIGTECGSVFQGWPEDLHEPFEGRGEQVDESTGVFGSLDSDWSVEVLDPRGKDYEVIKTRKSQTLAMTSGEFAIVRDFNEDIGGRDITLDYRYDGDGWFQIWADNQILYTENSFAQSSITVSIPINARAIKLVLGATDDSRDHELTLFDLILSPPRDVSNEPMTSSCQDGEVQYGDINGQAFCLMAGCNADEDCPNGGVCNFDEQQGISLCLRGCAADDECTDGRVCVDATEEASLCAYR